MAITNVALVGNQGLGHTAKVHFLNLFDFDLDASYPEGGYTAFSDTVKTVIGADKTIIGIIQMGPAGGYTCRWVRTLDLLKVYRCPGDLGVEVEVTPAANLATVTNVEFMVFSK